jgi:hypothetical protein
MNIRVTKEKGIFWPAEKQSAFEEIPSTMRLVLTAAVILASN